MPLPPSWTADISTRKQARLYAGLFCARRGRAMRFLDMFKRSRSPSSEDLFTALSTAVESNDETAFDRFCRNNRDSILAQCEAWRTAPKDVRSKREAVHDYARTWSRWRSSLVTATAASGSYFKEMAQCSGMLGECLFRNTVSNRTRSCSPRKVRCDTAPNRWRQGRHSGYIMTSLLRPSVAGRGLRERSSRMSSSIPTAPRSSARILPDRARGARFPHFATRS
jgi:hypothetical protein